MTADMFLAGFRDSGLVLPLIGAGIVAALILLALLLRRLGQRGLSTAVTGVATILGLGWSAQGMWDTAVHEYQQDVVVASVLFVVFEAMQVARMLKAAQYRADPARRTKHVRAVWVIAVIMAAVVALGEGWTQAPARLAIPLLVAYGWWTDLTADDDPAQKMATSLRWTPRRIGLAIGMLEPEQRDARTIDTDRLRDRMTTLAFRLHHGTTLLNDVFRRDIRLSRLKTLAAPADLDEVRRRLAQMSVDLMKPLPTLTSTPFPRIPAVALPARRSTRSSNADRIAFARASMTPERPKGMTAKELAEHFGISIRLAETVVAEARKQVNGSPLATTL